MEYEQKPEDKAEADAENTALWVIGTIAAIVVLLGVARFTTYNNDMTNLQNVEPAAGGYMAPDNVPNNSTLPQDKLPDNSTPPDYPR